VYRLYWTLAHLTAGGRFALKTKMMGGPSDVLDAQQHIRPMLSADQLSSTARLVPRNGTLGWYKGHTRKDGSRDRGTIILILFKRVAIPPLEPLIEAVDDALPAVMHLSKHLSARFPSPRPYLTWGRQDPFSDKRLGSSLIGMDHLNQATLTGSGSRLESVVSRVGRSPSASSSSHFHQMDSSIRSTSTRLQQLFVVLYDLQQAVNRTLDR
jgi:hypothetical protein